MNFEVFDVIAIIFSILCPFLAYRQGKRLKIIKVVSDREDGWLDIKKYPISPDFHGNSSNYILATNGEEVHSISERYRHYNKKGELILSAYSDKKPITHWMPYPNLPK